MDSSESSSSTYVMHLRRLKSVDEKEFAEFEGSDLIGRGESMKNRDKKSVRIKLAAIYDDEREIISILSSEVNMDSVQRLLSMHDERGYPCIFYAVESRSMKALSCILNGVNNMDCVIAVNGDSVLHVAAKMGDTSIVEKLLAHDLVVKLVDSMDRENGRTPLHLAAKFNHVEVAKQLLRHHARLDHQDSAGKTPVFVAAFRGHASLLEVFLQHEPKNVEKVMVGGSLYGTHYDNLLQVAVDSGDEKTVQVCFEQDPNIVRKCLQEEINRGDGRLIHSACKNGLTECLLKIVESMGLIDKLIFNKKDKEGFAPIHKAALNDDEHLVKYIGSLSDTLVNQTTEFSQTALILAAQCGHIKVVEELLNLKADFRIRDDSDRTVLHYAIEFPEILRVLLKRKDLSQSLVNSKEKDGYTPVHNAALKGLFESMNILLKHGADMNVFTNTSRSPLHCAVSSQCVDVVQLLLSNEPALVNKADATGKTPLHTAASRGNLEVVRCLLNNGALITRDDSMHSALHVAAQKGHLDIVELLVAFNGDIMDWKNKYGRTALISAASSSKSEVVKFLLGKDASVAADHELFNCLDWCLIKNDKATAMTMMIHSRWAKILVTTRHGTEGTMAKLVYKMPEVACRVLSNCIITQGHPDSKEYVKRYDFNCLQYRAQDKEKAGQVKPLTAVKTMVRTKCYSCLCHPVCCKFLKAKWMSFGWKVHFMSIVVYTIFLISFNAYAFQIPAFKETQGNKGDKGASVKVKTAMVVCLFFASVNVLKEVIQVRVITINRRDGLETYQISMLSKDFLEK